MQQQLWSHALLISSSIGPQAWQTCVDAFIAQTSASAVDHQLSQSLVTAYKLFGGSNQLAPSQQRKSEWRDSLVTVVANLKPLNTDTMGKLADQFQNLGLTEAAHIW